MQGPESKSLPSVLLHALQRITVAGLVRVSSSLYHTRCWKLYCGTPAEAAGCYLAQMALQGSGVSMLCADWCSTIISILFSILTN